MIPTTRTTTTTTSRLTSQYISPEFGRSIETAIIMNVKIHSFANLLKVSETSKLFCTDRTASKTFKTTSKNKSWRKIRFCSHTFFFGSACIPCYFDQFQNNFFDMSIFRAFCCVFFQQLHHRSGTQENTSINIIDIIIFKGNN